MAEATQQQDPPAAPGAGISDEFKQQTRTYVAKHNELLELQQRIKALKPEIQNLERYMFTYMAENNLPRLGVEGAGCSIGRAVATQISAVTAENIRDAVIAELPGTGEEDATRVAKRAMDSRKRKRKEQIRRIVFDQNGQAHEAPDQ